MQLLDLLFPKQCLGCKKQGSYLCLNCISSLPIVKQRCIVCEKQAIDGFTHPKCARKYSIDRMVSIWPYEGVMRKAILSLKYKFATEIAKELADHITRTQQISQTSLISLIIPNSLLIPIPMHWLRENWRGFNQTEEIGKLISEGLGLRYEQNLLFQTKRKQTQAGLKADARFKNIAGVFSLNPVHKSSISNPNAIFILFDDVYTTGATLKEAGKVLKRAGAKTVWALTIAR